VLALSKLDAAREKGTRALGSHPQKSTSAPKSPRQNLQFLLEKTQATRYTISIRSKAAKCILERKLIDKPLFSAKINFIKEVVMKFKEVELVR